VRHHGLSHRRAVEVHRAEVLLGSRPHAGRGADGRRGDCHAIEVPCRHGRQGAGARTPRVLREALRARCGGWRAPDRSRRESEARHPGRIPLPVRGGLPGGRACRPFRCAGNRAPCSRRGLWPGGASGQGLDLALLQERGGRRAVRLRLPRIGSRQLRGGCAGQRVRRGAQRRVLEGRRRRGLLLDALRQRGEWPAVRELERRELSQDVHQDRRLGDEGAPRRRSPGVPDLPARGVTGVARHAGRLDRALHDGPDQGGLVLPARRGVLRADRSLRQERRGRPARRREHVPLGARGGPALP